MSFFPQRRAWFALVLGLGAVLLFSGCVYLRLLELKRQIAQFDRHFDLRTDDGVRILCRTPVLFADDVRWIGLRPETTKKLGTAEHWHVRWEKELPPGKTEKGAFSIQLELMFSDGKLSGVMIPEAYFSLLPKPFVIGVIKSLGGAKVDKSQRTAEAAVSPAQVALARPSLPAIDKILGMPTEERVVGTQTIQRYRYVPVTKEPRTDVFEMTLRFDTKSGDLQHWHGRTPMGNIAFDFGK